MASLFHPYLRMQIMLRLLLLRQYRLKCTLISFIIYQPGDVKFLDNLLAPYYIPKYVLTRVCSTACQLSLLLTMCLLSTGSPVRLVILVTCITSRWQHLPECVARPASCLSCSSSFSSAQGLQSG